MRAFFVGFQRVTAIRTGARGLIPATRGLMGGNTISHLDFWAPFPGRKITVSRRRGWRLRLSKSYFVTPNPHFEHARRRVGQGGNVGVDPAT